MSRPSRHPEESAFLAAIAAAPENSLPRLVFADWLEERNDPRGAWVRDADIWEWMKPDAHDPIPGILEAVPALPRGVRYSIEREKIDWKRRESAESALFELGTSAVDAVRKWFRNHPEHWPGEEVQGFMLCFQPEKLRSVPTLRAKLKEQSWVDVWFAVVDLGFHKVAAAPVITALTEIDGWERWPALVDAVDRVELPVENAICHTLGRIGPPALKVVPWLASNMWLYPESGSLALINLRANPDEIVDYMNTDEDHEVEAGIHNILELADDPVAFLIRNAQRRTWRVAYCSLWLLANMGPKAVAALPALHELRDNRTGSDAEYVREAAIRAIEAISPST